MVTGQFPSFLLVVRPNPSLSLFNFVRIDIDFLKKNLSVDLRKGHTVLLRNVKEIFFDEKNETRPLVKN